MTAIENKYARKLAAKTMNHWAKLVHPDRWGWIPTINSAHLGEIPESGRPDGIAVLDFNGIAIGVEVKGFDDGKLDLSKLKDNQIQWVDSMLLPTYVFLMGFKMVVPANADLRKKEFADVKNSVKVWMVPVEQWIATKLLLDEVADVRTIHWDTESPRQRVAARENKLTLVDLWSHYELEKKNGYWMPVEKHPLKAILDARKLYEESEDVCTQKGC